MTTYQFAALFFVSLFGLIMVVQVYLRLGDTMTRIMKLQDASVWLSMPRTNVHRERLITQLANELDDRVQGKDTYTRECGWIVQDDGQFNVSITLKRRP